MIDLHIKADFSEYIDAVDFSIRQCIADAVKEALYDAVKLEVRRAFLGSPLRAEALPKVVDQVLKNLIRGAADGS